MKSRKYHSFLLKFFFLALSCILLSSGSAAAQTLYGAADPDNNDVSDLYSIDPANGDAMLIGPIGFRGVTGLAFLPDGRLIGSARSPNTTSGGIIIFHAILIEIDPTTGAGNLIGEIDTSEDGCGRIPDISFDRTKNTLFGVGSTNGCASRSHLYTIDPQAGGGGIPLANATGFDGTGNGLAVHPQTGIVYHTPSDVAGLVTLDLNTGVGTLIQTSDGNVPFAINALDFHPVTLELYGSHSPDNGGSNFLVKINLTDGTTTILGPTVLTLDAIAFSNFCGDGQPAFNEECDDGNSIDGDGCESDCTLTCGNGNLDSGEQCDDGNLIDGDGCEVDCTLTKPIPPPSPTPSATPQPGFNEGLGGGGGCSLGLGEAPREIAGSALLLLGMVFSIVLLARKAGR